MMILIMTTIKIFLISQANITLMWDPVASNVKNNCIVVSYYKVYRRKRGKDWLVKHYAIRRDPPFVTTLKTEYEFAVTAVVKDENNKEYESEKSNSIFINTKQ